MAEERRLIGDDGKLMRGTLAGSAEDTTFAEDTWYKIKAKAESDSVFGDLAVDDFVRFPTDITATSGDEAYALTTSQFLDLSGWSLDITGDEVEVTVLNDTYKKYRKGKQDAQGTCSFVFIKGISDDEDELANYFFDVVHISATGAVTVYSRSTDTIYLVGYLDDTTTSGEAMLATIMEVELFNFSLPMNMSEAVTMDVPFRLQGDSDPILYRIMND